VTYHAALIQDPQIPWGTVLQQLHPGAWVAAIGVQTLQARSAGFEVRDSIFCATPSGPVVTWLLRKPPGEATVASQTLATGTGGINIDGCRISTGDVLSGGAYSQGGRAGPMAGDSREGASLGMFQQGPKPAAGYQQPSGRWPANFCLIHTPGCVELSPATAPRTSATKANPKAYARRVGAVHAAKGGLQTPGRLQSFTGYADEDGTETVRSFKCSEGCPAKTLDAQGIQQGVGRAGNKGVAKHTIANKVCQGEWKPFDHNPDYYGAASSVAATRFFYQATSLQDLLDYLVKLILPPSGTLLKL
jgi:hypothetical protein